MVVLACDPSIDDAVWVENETASDLQFRLITTEGEPFDLSVRVDAGEGGWVLSGGQLGTGSGLTVNGCTVGDLIALDPEGREVARHPPPLCADGVWTIGTSSPQEAPRFADPGH